jgi:hypothetical protein
LTRYQNKDILKKKEMDKEIDYIDKTMKLFKEKCYLKLHKPYARGTKCRFGKIITFYIQEYTKSEIRVYLREIPFKTDINDFEISVENVIKIVNKSFKNLEVAYLFGLIQFYNNGYIQIRENDINQNFQQKYYTKEKRFFEINKKLPNEIRILICNLAHDSKKEIISEKYLNEIFKLLKDSFFWLQISMDKSDFFENTCFISEI